MAMAKLGDVSKGILIFFCGYYLFIAVEQAMIGQNAIATFMLAGFLIPLSIVIHSHIKNLTEKRAKLGETPT